MWIFINLSDVVHLNVFSWVNEDEGTGQGRGWTGEWMSLSHEEDERIHSKCSVSSWVTAQRARALFGLVRWPLLLPFGPTPKDFFPALELIAQRCLRINQEAFVKAPWKPWAQIWVRSDPALVALAWWERHCPEALPPLPSWHVPISPIPCRLLGLSIMSSHSTYSFSS